MQSILWPSCVAFDLIRTENTEPHEQAPPPRSSREPCQRETSAESPSRPIDRVA